MRKTLLIVIGFLLSLTTFSQLLSWTPTFPTESTTTFTITMDASKGNKGLNNYVTTSDVYVHTGVITSASTSSSDWRYVKFNQVFTTTNPSLVATYVGGNRWQFTITGGIRAYYGVPAGETILKIAILFRSGNGSLVQRNTDGSDMYIPVSSTALDARITNPLKQPTYNQKPEPIAKIIGNTIAISGASNAAATLKLYFNGTLIQTATAATTIAAATAPTITVSGTQTIILEASVGTVFKYDTIKFYVPGTITVAALPAGVRDGINYETDSTAVTFVLYAPGKSRVSIIGDIPGSNWDEVANYQMKKSTDGNYWWLRVTGLTPGYEYSFQYLIDGNLPVSDPYVEKVLDPYNDQYITSTTFPGIKAYPTGYTIGIVGTFQTKQTAYAWTALSYTRPEKKKMVIYELLLRDFIANHDWKTLKDSINYFRNLGINAIEIMPPNEFEGNSSWGYNPDFYFAPDKYYGPKNDMKQFIDVCHSYGIAVIMDISLNHSFGLSPMVQMYWDSVNNRPAANNPWFNPVAKHGFSVGYDFNHESLATRYFTSRVMEHWLVNYKIDGFRFDLSKGFTQTQTCDATGNNCSVGTWSAYDLSRINIWKRYYDTMQLKSPGSIPILEHFADNSEEIELSNYGFLLWGNLNSNFAQTTMGFVSGSDLSYGLHINRGWTNPHLVTYMESHDEERINFKNISYGNVYNGYSTKDTNVAPKRMELAFALMLSMPGPKMIYQFGELAYDSSINFCQNGTISTTCRTDPKPLKWGYYQDPERRALYNLIGNMNKLRNNTTFSPLFTFGVIGYNLSGLIKTISVTQGGVGIMTMANMDVVAQTATVTFPTAGTWYNYLAGGTFTSTATAQSITLNPGEYRVYTNQLVPLCSLTMVLNNGADTVSTCVSPYVLTAPSGYQSYFWNTTGATTASINVTTTGWYKCTVTQGNCSANDSVYVKVATVVPTPTSITSRTGNFTPCINDTITYVVVSPTPSTSQATPAKFRWTRPAGTTVLATNTDSSRIQIRYDATFVGGTLSVAGVSACGLAGTAFSTTLKYGVPTPTAITARTGTFTPCINDTITYTVTSPAASAAQVTPTKYRWTVPVGTTVLLTNADSSQIRIRYDATFVGGTLSVAAVSNCNLAGTAFSTTLKYGVPTPTAITARTGTFTPCINDTITYTVTTPAASAAQVTPTKFRWTRPVGTTVLLTNADSSQIQIRYDATFVGGTLSVAGVSNCSIAGAAFSTTLKYGVPTPTSITARTGTFTPCINDTITYTVTSPAASAAQVTPTKYRWTRPVGTTVLLTNADSSQIRIRYDATFVGGTLSVAGVSACGLAGTSFSSTLAYLPPTPTNITSRTGLYNACINDTITYTVVVPAVVAGQRAASVYRWTIPAFTAIQSAAVDSSSIKLKFNTGYIGGNLTVKGQTACGATAQGTARTQALTHTGCPAGTKLSTTVTEVVVDNDLKVAIYPNPSHTDFNLEMLSGSNEKLKIVITDAEGRTLKTMSTLPNGIKKIGNDLQPGVYMVKIMQGKITKTLRIVKY